MHWGRLSHASANHIKAIRSRESFAKEFINYGISK